MATTDAALADIDDLADRLEPMAAEDVLRLAVDRYAPRIVLTCSWQKQSSILVHMLSEVAPETRIVELDTGLLFPETYDTRARLIERYGLAVERVLPEQTVAEQATAHGPRLWEREPDRCCGLRKVAPLGRALVGMDAWITGIRRSQSATRAGARKLQLDVRRGVVKVQPLVDWSDEDCWRFIMRHRIPYNPLHDQGYPSVGCVPCTRAVTAGEDERAGRWAGTGKTECGLH
jgi:phosphoadenosine phosphosulfate reductase